MATPRAANVADLPRLPQPLPMTFAGPLGLCMGEIWWIDAQELVLWSAELPPGGRELPSRVDFRKGTIAELGVTLLDGEPASKHRNGWLHVLRWKAKADDASRLGELVRSTNPAAFTADYQPVRLPLPVDEPSGPTEPEAAPVPVPLPGKRRSSRFLLGLFVGVGIGAVGGLALAEKVPPRRLLYSLQPDLAIRYGLLRGAAMAGADFEGHALDRADLSGSQLAGANLARATLGSANLSGANLARAELAGANLAGANLAGANVDGADFGGADVRGADLRTPVATAKWSGALFSKDTQWSLAEPPHGALGPAGNAEGVDLTAVVGAGADLAGMRLSGAILVNADLHGAKLADADVTAATLTGANLAGADLSRAKMASVKAENINLRGATLEGTQGAGAILFRADLSATTGSGIRLAKANLSGANLSGVVWKGADLRDVDFGGANLTGAQLNGCLLFGANFAGATVDNAHFDDSLVDAKAHWSAGVSPADLGAKTVSPGANLPDLNLEPETALRDLDLAGLHAERMVAHKADFSNSGLQGASLSGADLVGASFAHTALAGANFSTAKLVDASFASADLSNAKFDGASVCGADFSTARLDGASFAGAVACASTQWPGGTAPAGLHKD